MEFAEIDHNGATDAVHRQRISQSGVPPRYQVALDDYGDAVDLVCEARSWLSLWGDTRPERGLYLQGVTGCGKSTLAGAIACELVKTGRTIQWVNVSEFFSRLRGSWGQRDESEDRIVKDLTSADCLVLDDLGVWQPSPWALDVLYRVITRVYENKRVVVVTSNLSGSALKATLSDGGDANTSERIVSRLSEMMISLGEFPQTDYRLAKARKNDGKHGKVAGSGENPHQVSRETK